MTGKRKKTILLIIISLCLISLFLIGFRYLPFARLIKLPSGKNSGIVIPNRSSAGSPNSYLYDFELREGESLPGGFYTGIAHSGKNSVRAFGQNSFSYAVEHTVASIGPENLREVSLSAWIYVLPTEKEVKGSLVFTASNQLGVNVCWKGVSLHEPEIPRGKWFRISGRFDLSDVTFHPDTRIQVYFWNTSSTDILIDDYFIVFGGEKPRRGDSAIVDLTRPEGFVPRFNYPPFPTSWLAPADTNDPLAPGDIGPEELITSGDFFGSENDGLLVFGAENLVKAFSFCPNSGVFVKQNLHSTLPAIGEIKALIPGKFSGKKKTDLLVITNNLLILTTLTPLSDPCAPSGGVILQVISSTNNNGVLFAAGPFSGHNRTELLTVHSDGNWELNYFDTKQAPGHWKVIATSAGQPVEQWNADNFTTRLHTAPFLSRNNQALLLSISTSLKKGSSGYAMMRFNTGVKSWDPVPGFHFPGITCGLDTLRPENQFFFISGKDSRPTLLRYDRSWRYDLKEIEFNDTTFVIRRNIDFTGFGEIKNPKFYESLRILPVAIKYKGNSLLLIGHNAAERNYGDILRNFSKFVIPVQQP